MYNYSLTFVKRITLMTTAFLMATLTSLTFQPEDSFDKIKPKEIDQQPVYGDCDRDTEEDRQKCSSFQIKRFFSQNMIYPPVAKKDGIEGKVVVEVTVTETGSLENVHVQKTANKELNKEALRLCNALNKWSPAKAKKKVVPARIFIPVNFTKRSEAFLKE